MKVLYSIKINFLLFFFINIGLIISQISDNFEKGELEDGNYDLLDVTDYHNLGLIVSSSKSIYTGIPPVKKIETDANLFKFSHLITINTNYLLVACLEDSFLGKIDLSTGRFISLLSYSQIKDALNDLKTSQLPDAICSLSNIDDTIFIGFTQVINSEDSYNTIFKFTLENKDDITDGPILADSSAIESFFFAQLNIETTSLRQISCEPLKIIDNPNDYRLICLFLSISHNYIDDVPYIEYDLFAKTVKPNFDESDFQTKLRENELTNSNKAFGFRIYREDDTYARCLTGNSLIEIYLDANAEITKTSFSSDSYNLNSEIDLISYNNEFIFSAQIISYMDIENIFSFQINQKTYENYFRLNDLEETIVHKILGYFDNVKNKVIFLYQTENKIKFFIMENKEEIYNLPTLTHTIKMSSFQTNVVQYDLNNLCSNPPLRDLGNLNVEQIKKRIDVNGNSYEYQYFGTHFDQLLIEDNILIPEQSLNYWKTYNLSFIEKVEGQYIRIYHLASLTINIETCKSGCFSCYENYDTCTDCTQSGLASLEDKDYECYPITFLIVQYIYDQDSNKFRKCYESCEFCSAVSSEPSDHKCNSCLPGYLNSYKYPGSCFPYTNLQITEDKEVDITQEKFISSTCSQYKIVSTGECIETCPSTPVYYSLEYNAETNEDEKVFFDSKYSFGNKCYEQCPENSNANENNECICNNYFYNDNDGNIICLSEANCPTDYPYLNQDTKECFHSLENCNYFFIDTCYYNNCPTNTILLSTQSEEFKNYIKEKLSLNDNLINKICICDTTNNGVWSNININTPYYQECLNSCPSGYIPEPITKQCILDTSPPIPQPQLPDEQDNKCPVKYQGICYSKCPEGTCLTQEDPKLKTCVIKNPLMQVFNGICFENFEDIINDIKAISEREQVIIIKESGIIIHGYPAKKKKEKPQDKKAKYSFVNLGDCEKKIISYYNLPENTELYILGIDTPNKDILSSSNVFNYGVYLQNGTLLDHNEACKDTKVTISTPITNPDAIKLKEAEYFSDMGYDIFDENSDFYKDRCAPASIDENDIILSDRKKDFYPEGISLCNDSCHYSEVDLENKRFTCECDLNYDFSATNKKEKKKEKNQDDESYIDYFLSLINYKIIKCYKLFFDYKSYYYNIGFYISVGTLIFCSLQIYIYTNCGKKSMNLIILDNAPDEKRLKEMLKEQQKRSNELSLNKDNNNNPPKKTVQFEFKGDLKNKRKTRKKGKTVKILKTSKSNKTARTDNKILKFDSKEKIKFQNSNEVLTINNINIKDGINVQNMSKESINIENISKDNLNNRELNILPFSQALRTDKRNYFQIFLSVLSHEIKIISIFYYRHPYEHISLILSEYIFELCLDLTFNCFLYTEDVISEKYNNNGSIRFFTTLSLSFISNIISSIIAYFLWKLANYAEFLEFIIRDVNYESKYYLNIMRFNKILCLKLGIFFFLQILINLAMSYYLMIFCTVYHNTQGSVMINYLTGIIESIIISFGFTLIISILRAISIKCKSKSAYYTSKYFFEKF